MDFSDIGELKPRVPYSERSPEQRLADVRLAVSDLSIFFPNGEIELTQDWRPGPEDQAAINAWLESGRKLIILPRKERPEITTWLREAGIPWAAHAGQKDMTLQVAALEQQCEPYETAFIGTDLSDLAAMRICGFCAATPDAEQFVTEMAYLVGQKKRGPGALADILTRMLAGEFGG